VLKIGMFSKLSHLTVKALRYYEKEGILKPAAIDEWTGYRYYEPTQLETAARIKAFRQLELSIDEIKLIFSGADEREILRSKAKELAETRTRIDTLISSIHHILEEKEMKVEVTEKVIPAMLVFSSETLLAQYADIMAWIPSLGEECLRLNPGLQCAEPEYEFCEYLDAEYRETDIRIRHSQAVTEPGVENDIIKFRRLPETRVLSIYHRGSYDNIGASYAFLVNYAKQNGYKIAGLARECYLDGIWNKETPDEWLTEIQLPIG